MYVLVYVLRAVNSTDSLGQLPKNMPGPRKTAPARGWKGESGKAFLQLLLVFMRGVCAYAHYVLEQELVVAQVLTQFLVVVLKAYAREFTV